MAQVSRAVRKGFLLLCPPGLRLQLLRDHPNFRKAAPAGMQFVFPAYLGDITVNIDTTYKVERIMWTGEYEPPLLRFLETHDTRGWKCFDVGANVGAVALALARYAGPEGKVYAVEPGPPTLQRLRENFALNPALGLRTEILGCGVSDQPGELWWTEEPDNPGNALLADHGTHKIPVTTLDAIVEERAITDLDFLKIDVEGMEYQVLRGAAKTLRRFCPAIYLETLSRYVDSASGASFRDLQKLLAGDFGYRLFRLTTSGQLAPLEGTRHGGYTFAVHPDRPLRDK